MALLGAGHLSDSGQEVGAHLRRLVPIASRLAVQPLRNAPAGPKDLRATRDMVQLTALVFLSQLLLFGGPSNIGDLRQQALAAEPSLLEEVAAIVRRDKGPPGDPKLDPEHFGSALCVLAAFLQSPEHRSWVTDTLVEALGPALRPGQSEVLYRRALYALRCLVSRKLGLVLHVRKLVDQGIVLRLLELSRDPLSPATHLVLDCLSALAFSVGEAFFGPAPPGFSMQEQPANPAVGRLPPVIQELVARLSPKAVEASPENACRVLNTLEGIALHIEVHGTAMTLAFIHADVPLVLVRAAERLDDSEEALAFFEGTKTGTASFNMLYSLECMIPSEPALRAMSLPWGLMASVDILQDVWMRKLRGKLLPRLRKFLFHPDLMTRSIMISVLGLLGCLETEPFSDEADRDQLASSPTNLRLLARLLDPNATTVITADRLSLTEGALFDEVFPVLGPKELRVCDGCGCHDHFRCVTKAAPLKLMTLAAGGGANGSEATDMANWGVRQLKQHLVSRGVDFSGCIEKEQLLATKVTSAQSLSFLAVSWLVECAKRPAAQALLAGSPAVATFLERALARGHPSVQARAVVCAERLSDSRRQVEAHFHKLVPIVSRLAAEPLRNTSVDPDGLRDVGYLLQLSALSFLGRLLLRSVGARGDLRQQALAAEPRLLDVAAAILRRDMGAPGVPVVHPEGFGGALWVLAACLEDPTHRSWVADVLVEALGAAMRPGQLEILCGKSLFAAKKLVSKELGLASHVRQLVDQGIVFRLLELTRNPVSFITTPALDLLSDLAFSVGDAFLATAPPCFSVQDQPADPAVGKLPPVIQELVARLSPQVIKASPENACLVLNTFQGIAWHIQGDSSATATALACVNADVLLVLVRAAKKLDDSREALAFKDETKLGTASINMLLSMDFIIPSAVSHHAMSLLKDLTASMDPPQDTWLCDLRGKLLPRLRKFLFHPDVMTRRVMISLLAVLGCLEMEPVSDEAGRDQLANSPTNLRLLARLLDPNAATVIFVDRLSLPEGTLFDEVFPVLGPAELRVCDGCGCHDHFRCVTKAAPLKLMVCNGCRQRRYCSPQCQKRHWKHHKACCKAQAAAAEAAAASG
ncbi:hypothetical protein N2152v2_004474 [Parachlorella kessleri]